MEATIEKTIQSFLAEQLLIEFIGDIDENSDLFQLGLMDSYNYIELIRFVETEFELKFTNDEILADVVVSLAGITSLVYAKKAAKL